MVVSEDLDLSDFPPLSGVNVGAAAVNIDDGVTDVNTDAGHVVSGEASGQKLDWKSLFQNQSLSFFPPVERDGKIVVKPPSQVLADGAKQWTNALLGNFLGKSPPLSVFQRMADKLWGREGSVEIRFLAPSVYLINFPSQGVAAKDTLPGSILVELSESNRVEVTVELVWSPPKCDHCSIFGHSFDKFVKKDVLVVDVNTEVVNTVDKGECSNSLNVSTKHSASPISEIRDVSTAVGCAGASLCVVAEEQEVSPRKPRLAATRLADLMNQLKPKAKKKKKVKEGDLQGGSSNFSQ
ncbi:hypothetical protein V6N12_032219 [Hibiscus sabdariffa]|uniref:DUF4283 domain-containing protein n=1 Tax=Hibiscus sabdariffa TaxID=183260 RepID=A0ABR2CBZ8_9ROSI